MDDLNAQILDQSQRCLDKDEAFGGEYSTLDIGKEIDQLNPILMNAIPHLQNLLWKEEVSKQVLKNSTKMA